MLDSYTLPWHNSVIVENCVRLSRRGARVDGTQADGEAVSLLILGIALLVLGGLALLLMTISGAIPRLVRWPYRGTRKEDDPDAWELHLIAYGAMAAAGALMILIGLVMGW
jgi:hypothetical protein